MIKNFKNFLSIISVTGTKKSYLIFLLLLMLVSSFADILSLGLIIPYVSQILNIQENSINYLPLDLGFFKNTTRENLIFYLTIFLILIFFLKTVITILIRWLISSFSYKQFAILQVKLLNLYQNMKYEDHISRSTSDYIKNLRELSMECVRNIELTLKILCELIIFIVIILFLGLINYKILLLFFLTFLPIYLVYEIFLKPINIRLGKTQTDALRNTYNIIDNSMRGFKETRILGKESFFKKKIQKFANIFYETQKKSTLIIDSPRYVFEFFIILVSLSIILILSKHYDLNSYVPLISIYFVAAIRLLPGISLIASSQSRISLGQYAVTQIVNDITNLKNVKADQKKQKNIITNEFKDLRFKNVDFSYQNTGTPVLKNINFELNKNECIGIMGKSGEGKTTFVDVMLGLLKPQSGEILINDNLIDDYVSNFVGTIAYVPQEPIILDEKISTNIALETNEKEINYEKLQYAINQANFNQVVEKFQKKTETKVGDNGIRLSGGQNKRLALSRAFYHGKKIIVIDEATSALDFKTESLIAEEIKLIKGKTTIVIISHSENILKYCDKIYTIEDKSIKLLKQNVIN